MLALLALIDHDGGEMLLFLFLTVTTAASGLCVIIGWRAMRALERLADSVRRGPQ
jgi:hypothetical protein